MRLGHFAGALWILAAAGCHHTPAPPPLNLPAGCQPLMGGADCFLPYPSDFYRVPDPSLPSGFRIKTTGAAALRDARNNNADVNDWRPVDGYSKTPLIVTYLPEAISPDGFAKLLDPPDSSVSPSSNTLILEADTGTAIAHFVDLDARATDLTRQAISLHPLVGLKPLTRYVVALQGVKQTDGTLAPAPEGFRRLRDGQASSDPALAPLATEFKTLIFPVIAKAGVDVSQLQLAWEFTTGSDDHASANMLRVRSLTLAWLAQNVPQVNITQVTMNPSSAFWMTVDGTVTGPLFLTNDKPGGTFNFDGSGQVAQNGTTSFPFRAQIPVTVRDQFGPGRPLAYGHGFFGSIDELNSAGVSAISDRLGAVVFSTNWWGMSADDVGTFGDALTAHLWNVGTFTDRVHQAMANWLVLTAAIEGPLWANAAFHRPLVPGPGVSTDAQGNSNAGAALYTQQARYFLGISEGHILGGTLAALNPEFNRVALQVGGAGLTHLMFRAQPFSGFLFLLDTSLKDPLNEYKFAATMQRQVDTIDPAFWAQNVLAQPLTPSQADRMVLMQTGLGDLEVPNLGAFLHARLLGLDELQPAPAQPWGIPTVTGTTSHSAQTLWDFGIDLQAAYAQAMPGPNSNPVHETLRLQSSSLAQLDAFFQPGGQIIQPCSGAPCKAQ